MYVPGEADHATIAFLGVKTRWKNINFRMDFNVTILKYSILDSLQYSIKLVLCGCCNDVMVINYSAFPHAHFLLTDHYKRVCTTHICNLLNSAISAQLCNLCLSLICISTFKFYCKYQYRLYTSSHGSHNQTML